MNWLKKISSSNIRFTDEIEQDVKEITKTVLDYFLNKNTKTFVMDLWKFYDPYNKTQRTIKIVIFPSSYLSGIFAQYDPREEIISIFPYNLKVNTEDKTVLFNTFKDAIKHEVVHVIDPKLKIKQIKQKNNEYHYYSSPEEFDAYSKQIVEHLKRQIKDDRIKKVIIEWLKYGILTPDNPMSAYSNAIHSWEKSDQNNKTDYIRRLKLRIYHEVLMEIT